LRRVTPVDDEFSRWTAESAKGFHSTRSSALPMTNPAASSLADLEAAVHRSNVDAAVRAAIETLRAKCSPIAVVCSAGRGFASSYDGTSAVAARGLVALSSSVNLLPFLQAQFHSSPLVLAIA